MLSHRNEIGNSSKKEGKEKTLYISPMNYQGAHTQYDQAVVEAREQKLERDFAGAPLPKGYWISWMILIVLVMAGLIFLSVFTLF